MNNAFLTTSIFIVFVFSPILGLYFVISDIIKSRKYGRELHSVADGLRANLDLLRKGDMPEFEGLFSGWLESKIRLVKSDWVRVSIRLTIATKAIGLGENHREALLLDGGYRKKTLEYCYGISNSYDRGDTIQVYSYLAKLLGLFYCGQNLSINVLDQRDPNDIVIEALQKSSVSIQTSIFDAENDLSFALEEISDTCKTEDAGFPLLVIQWALIKLKEKKQVEKSFLFRSKSKKKYISKLFESLAQLIQNEDMLGVINAISGNF